MALRSFWKKESSPAPLERHWKRKQEARHFIGVGDSGSGKSQFFKQILYYIKACGDVAVVVDPKGEFTPEFCDRSRGDVVLHPYYRDCPYWHPGKEVRDQADGLQVARAAYPHHPNDAKAQFFDDGAAQTGGYLLWKECPDCHEYADLLDHDAKIDEAIKGTRLERTLSKNAAGQRSAILQVMNAVAIPFRMMPKRDGRPSFSILDYVQHRRGSVFIPNPYETREAMVPLISMWVDLLMLRTLAMGPRPDLPRIWFLIDEADSLNTLPQLQTGMTELRFTGNPLVLGVQNMAQLEDRYGTKAKTIFSQAGSKLVFATSEPHSAKYLSDLIGECEIRRLKESYSHERLGWRRSVTVDTIRKPLVSPVVIQNLPDLECLVIRRNHVVRVALPYLAPVIRDAELVPQTPEAPRPGPHLVRQGSLLAHALDE